jgi:hypothetical protein
MVRIANQGLRGRPESPDPRLGRRGTHCALALQWVVAVAEYEPNPAASSRPRRDAPAPSVFAGYPGGGAGARPSGSGYPPERVGAAPGLRGVATEAPDLSHKLQGRDTSVFTDPFVPSRVATLHPHGERTRAYKSRPQPDLP